MAICNSYVKLPQGIWNEDHAWRKEHAQPIMKNYEKMLELSIPVVRKNRKSPGSSFH